VLYVKEEEEIAPHPGTASGSSTLASASGTMDINSAPWYYESYSREKSEACLRGAPLGTYLIRASSSHVGDYSLSVNIGAQIEHFKISFDVSDRRYVFGVRRFETLFALVAFYQINAVFTLVNQTPIFLVQPYRPK
jgi:hypothetical protein